MSEGFTLSGPEQVQAARILTMRSALKFEVKTGIKMSRVSALQAARRDGLTTKSTKKAALKEVDAFVVEHLGMESVYNEDGTLK